MAYHNLTGKIGYVYNLANYNRNVLYVGSELVDRVGKHRIGKGAKYTAKYNVKYLMYFEEISKYRPCYSKGKAVKELATSMENKSD